MALNPAELQEIASQLNQGAWFKGLPPALKSSILGQSVVHEFAKGQVVQIDKHRSRALTAVLRGQVAMQADVGGEEPALVHVAGPGFWFGEIGVLLDEAAPAIPVALSSVQALFLPKAAFDRIVDVEPRYYREIARLSLERSRLLFRFLAETLQLSPDHRLRIRLADLADVQRTQSPTRGAAVTLKISQAELGRIVGLSRQRLNARLRKLQEEGWVEIGVPRQIKVLDPAGLRASAAKGLAPE